MKIDGKKIAQELSLNLKERILKLKKENIIPKLAIILLGNDPASLAYVKQKVIKAESIGIKITVNHLPENASEKELLKIIKSYNEDKNIHGIIVQQPFPKNINTKNITQAIDPQKDVDGFNFQTKYEMPIAMAVLEILKIISLPLPFTEWLKSKNVVVIGKGETGGKPIIKVLKQMNITPIIIDSKTENPKEITKKADIIISAVGKADMVKEDTIKNGVILIGIGLHKEKDGKIKGDYDSEKIKQIASFYTPSPGGVGPINVICLLKNVVTSAETL